MRRGWGLWILVAVLLAGLSLGVYAGTARRAEAVSQEELYEAINSWLTEAHVPSQDMPKAIIAVTPLPDGRYLVHMRMVQGEGWFECSQKGGKWEVKGAPPPAKKD